MTVLMTVVHSSGRSCSCRVLVFAAVRASESVERKRGECKCMQEPGEPG